MPVKPRYFVPGMWLYVVQADDRGAYVASRLKHNEIDMVRGDFIAVFHNLNLAREYAAYLSRTYSIVEVMDFCKGGQ